MKKRIILMLWIAAVLVLSCALVSCDKLFIPGDVPDGPSALTLSSDAGERTSEPLSYNWRKTKTDTVSGKEGPDPLSASYDPLIVQPGERLCLTFADGNVPWIVNAMFYESDGEGEFLEMTALPQPEKEEGGDAYFFSAPEEDGVIVVEALWPRWVNTGISAEAIYGFYVWSAKG